jgi:hypothetical protein
VPCATYVIEASAPNIVSICMSELAIDPETITITKINFILQLYCSRSGVRTKQVFYRLRGYPNIS